MKPLQLLRSDLRLTQALARVAPKAARNRPGGKRTVADAFESLIAERPHDVAIIDASDNGRELTYGELGRHANRVAHWALDQGITQGSVVALLMPNRPEYVATWLGLAKVGAITALINTNLTGDALRHSIDVADADHLIVERELVDAWRTADGGADLTEWHTGPTPTDGPADGRGEDLDAALARVPESDLDPAARAGMLNSDPLFYIYTSGTTGLPKAARFSHVKFLLAAPALGSLIDLRPSDRMYVTLPLYHTAGGVMALGGTLLMGGTAVLTRKFSASRFWDEVHRHDATAFQYIGELCRYLVNSPSHPLERSHRLRICVGNGLRPDVWPEFQERFAIPKIVEFYGATEGNTTLVNLDNRVGAIGRLPPGVSRAIGLHLVEFDVEAGDVRRDGAGRCIPVKAGEPGEAIARITETVPFDGYSDEEATERKILRNVFKEGDAYFRTGDLLRRDREGYYYFVDRIGDTFRWKGENVSTAEVAGVLGSCRGVQEANVYGVEVPGTDGRAGMATLVVDDQFDLEELQRQTQAELAAYARPVFLRIKPELEITATFKHRKVDAVAEGFDPAVVSDPLYLLHPNEGGYVPLDAALHAEVLAGAIRL